VCIAHRLSTIKNADNIIVVSRGEIVEQGTHADLIALGGVYKGLVEAQRISVDRKEEIEHTITEEDPQEEAIDEMVRVTSAKSLEEDGELALTRPKTGKSDKVIEADTGFTGAGAVPQTRYSNFQLIRKVLRSCGWDLTVVFNLESGGASLVGLRLVYQFVYRRCVLCSGIVVCVSCYRTLESRYSGDAIAREFLVLVVAHHCDH